MMYSIDKTTENLGTTKLDLLKRVIERYNIAQNVTLETKINN